MPFQKTVDRDTAMLLRRAGWSYKDIAEYVGCSEIWCKRVLNNIEKDKQLMTYILELYKQDLNKGNV